MQTLLKKKRGKQSESELITAWKSIKTANAYLKGMEKLSTDCMKIHAVNKRKPIDVLAYQNGSKRQICPSNTPLNRYLDRYENYSSDFKTASTLKCRNDLGFWFTRPTRAYI